MQEWSGFIVELRAQSEMQSHQKLKLMSKIVNEAKNRRYDTDRRPKNAMVEHGFQAEEFRRFMSVVEDPKDRLMFLLIAVLGLRPNEAARLKGRDIMGDKLLIPASKGGYEADLRLPWAILRLLPAVGPDESLLGMSRAAMARRFRKYRKLAGFEEIYGRGKPGGRNGRQERQLFAHSLKSLRYTGAQMVRKMTKDILLASRLLRHRDIRTTVKYLEKYMKPELEAALEQSSEILLGEEREIPLKEAYIGLEDSLPG